jgi:predicted AAA+ superfamily ATPase
MLAHSHGQVSNLSQIASSFGVSQPTIRNYLHILAETFVVTILPPWHENIRKRQVKSPKLYISDSGLLHALLDLKDLRDVERHPQLGASWEGFAISAITQHLGASSDQCYFWATHQGAELDLLVVQGSKRFGFEIKRTVAPKKTKSMLLAMDALGLKQLEVVHSGKATYQLDSHIRAVAFSDLFEGALVH